MHASREEETNRIMSVNSLLSLFSLYLFVLRAVAHRAEMPRLKAARKGSTLASSPPNASSNSFNAFSGVMTSSNGGPNPPPRGSRDGRRRQRADVRGVPPRRPERAELAPVRLRRGASPAHLQQRLVRLAELPARGREDRERVDEVVFARAFRAVAEARFHELQRRQRRRRRVRGSDFPSRGQRGLNLREVERGVDGDDVVRVRGRASREQGQFRERQVLRLFPHGRVPAAARAGDAEAVERPGRAYVVVRAQLMQPQKRRVRLQALPELAVELVGGILQHLCDARADTGVVPRVRHHPVEHERRERAFAVLRGAA
eukprot:30828-Pelagococcus_subviridis.AAC.40